MRLRGRLCGSIVATVVAGTALLACSHPGDDDDSGRAQSTSWARVPLPHGVTPVTVSAMGDGLLVGARNESARLAPRLLVLASGRWRSIPLHASGYYAFRARWRSVITDGTRIYALGDAPGGAHSNPRWTSWQGDVDGVTEHPQFFETFGGPGAGGLTGMTFSAGRPEVVGSWTSESAGLDIVTWRLHGVDWIRGTATGTDLASNDHRLNVIRAVGDDENGMALAGAVTRLGNGKVSLDPAVWRYPEGGPWVRVDLPAGAPGQATGVRCLGSGCLAAGYINHRLAVWQVVGGHAEPLTGVPYVPVGTDSVALVGPPGAAAPAVLTGSRGHSVLISRRDGDWTSFRGPPGTPTAWAAVGGSTYVVTKAENGSSTLWSSQPAS